MATRRTAAIGMLASGTSAPRSTAKYLNQDREPPHEMRCRHANCLQNRGESVEAPGQLGEAMLHEAVSDDQTQRERRPAGHRNLLIRSMARSRHIGDRLGM